MKHLLSYRSFPTSLQLDSGQPSAVELNVSLMATANEDPILIRFGPLLVRPYNRKSVTVRWPRLQPIPGQRFKARPRVPDNTARSVFLSSQELVERYRVVLQLLNVTCGGRDFFSHDGSHRNYCGLFLIFSCER